MSTIEFSIDSQLALRLQELAASAGVDVPTFVRETIESQLATSTARQPVSVEERVAAWLTWTAGHPWIGAVAEDDREGIYAGRGE